MQSGMSTILGHQRKVRGCLEVGKVQRCGQKRAYSDRPQRRIQEHSFVPSASVTADLF